MQVDLKIHIQYMESCLVPNGTRKNCDRHQSDLRVWNAKDQNGAVSALCFHYLSQLAQRWRPLPGSQSAMMTMATSYRMACRNDKASQGIFGRQEDNTTQLINRKKTQSWALLWLTVLHFWDIISLFIHVQSTVCFQWLSKEAISRTGKEKLGSLRILSLYPLKG